MSSRREPRRLPIVLLLIAALMLTLAPLPEWAAAFRPNWVVLTLLYWSITLPHRYSVGAAWIIGLILDVSQGTLLGQHALALCLVVFLAVKFHLQLRVFPQSQMTATIFAMLATYQFILFWVNGVAGVHADAVAYWGPVISGTAFWPLLTFVFRRVRFAVRSSA